MKLKTAQKIIKIAAEKHEIYGVRLYKSYSGRGMFGKSTSGLVVDKNDCSKFQYAFSRIMNRLKSDNLGLDTIYY
jgi:hypothetical protein